MDIPEKLKKALPHIIAVLVFTVVTALFFFPQLEGKVLHTNDGTVAKNSSKEIRDFREKYGEEPLWTNSMFGGMPAYLISTKYPGNLLKYADTALRIVRMPISAILITMLGFYVLLLMFRVNPWIAIGGALAYGLSTYFIFILGAGHNTKAVAIAYMAPMIGSFWYAYKYDLLKGTLLATFFLTLEILANHPQITYYAILCLLLFLATEFIYSVKNRNVLKFLKRASFLAIPVILAVGMNFSSLYTVWEYGKYSSRGKSDLVTGNKQEEGLDPKYITQWSYGVGETFTLLIPDFRGGASDPFDRDSETVTALRKNNAGQFANQFQKYWGPQPLVDGPRYVGALIIFLFVLGLIIIKGPEKWWLLSATVFSVALAWGQYFMPLTQLFIDYFPGYDKFRAVTTILVIAEFCIPLLALLALRDIFNGTVAKAELMKGIKISLGITGGLTLLFALFPGMAGSFLSAYETEGQLPQWLSSALISDREAMLRSDAFRSFVFIVAGAGALIAFLSNKLKKEYAILLIGLLFLTDIFLVDKRYLGADRFKTPAAVQKTAEPSAADKAILEDKTQFRVLNLSVSPFNDASTSQWHKSIGGYHGAKMRRYQEVIDSVIIDDFIFWSTTMSTAKSFNDLQPAIDRMFRNNAINMLNTKYLILSPETPPLKNPNALGNAWMVSSILTVNNANEEIAETKSVDPGRIAVVDASFSPLLPVGVTGPEKGDTVYLKSYKPNELIYGFNAAGNRFTVFSEIWYPAGWKAFIDGKETPIARANYILRALNIPAGNHEVRFSFEPASWNTGNKISLASSLIFIFMVAGYLAWVLLGKKGFNEPV
jgi:hypothetical protein